MLQLSGSLINQPVMSLRTGGQIATIVAAIINPNNLKIEGFYCQDILDKKQPLILLYQDIRDIIPKGIVVNDYEVLAEPKDLVRLKKILALNFELIGKQVYTLSKEKLGKVTDYAADTDTMYVQKLYVGQSLLKSLTGGSLSVDRTQIVEITNRKVVIQDILQGTPEGATATAPVSPA
jgi:uncharacterized protein YrrD